MLAGRGVQQEPEVGLRVDPVLMVDDVGLKLDLRGYVGFSPNRTEYENPNVTKRPDEPFEVFLAKAGTVGV